MGDLRRPIDAGDLRNWVTLERNGNPSTPNAGGQAKPDYQPVVTGFYALVECVGVAEGPNGGQLKGVLRYRVTIRAGNGPVFPSDRLEWEGHTLNVVGASPDPFGTALVIDALEKGQQ
jgi:hypothetical protein